MTIAVHPLLRIHPDVSALDTKRKVFGKHLDYGVSNKAMNGFFDDLFDTVWDAVTGLSEAIGNALQSVVQAVAQIGETIALIVRAVVGDVKWSEVYNSLGKIFQDVGAILVYLNPATVAYDWLKNAPLTSHAFNELDKFTGGLITGAVNISSLPARALRGDPISRQELIRDALFGIQIAAIVFGGPIALGVMTGGWVGREVCSKQTQAKGACMAAFQIIGAAAGAWAANAGYGWDSSDWFGSADDALPSVTATPAEAANFIASDVAYQAAVDAATAAASTSFTVLLTNATETYLQNQGITQLSREAINLCKQSNWVGDHECEIIGRIAVDYIKSPTDEDWADFLAREIAAIGAEELMLQWFPPDSPEHRAIKRQWEIKYIDGGTVQASSGVGGKALLLLAAAAGTFFVGGLS